MSSLLKWRATNTQKMSVPTHSVSKIFSGLSLQWKLDFKLHQKTRWKLKGKVYCPHLFIKGI